MSLQNSKIIINKIYNKLSSSSQVTIPINQTTSMTNLIKSVVLFRLWVRLKD